MVQEGKEEFEDYIIIIIIQFLQYKVSSNICMYVEVKGGGGRESEGF